MRQFYAKDGEENPPIVFETSQPIGYSLIVDEEELINLYAKLYAGRKVDGQNYENRFMAKMYLRILDATYTAQEVFDLESHLTALMGLIENGSWYTAQAFNPTITLSGIYDQAMKDEIQEDFNKYVINNY